MSPRCTEVEALIDKRASGLDEAEGLVLEQHLSSCESCRHSAAFMRTIHEIVQQVPAELSERSRRRAITGAFDNVARTDAKEKQRRRLLWPVAMAVAAAAALLVFWRVPSPTTPQVAKVATPSAPTKAAPAVPVEQVDDEAWIEAKAAETRSFAHARVELAAGARVRFESESSTLELDEGRVTVDVDARQGKPFRVSTQRFRVEVLGTRFVVTPDRVEVMQGRVQVFDLEGKVLARELAAGAAFTYREPAANVEPPEPRVAARVWLARAREALSHGDPGAARALILRAEDSEPHRQDRAEAGTLRAECALIEHDAEAAIRLYSSVADRFADLSAGENAAFAAAQVATRSQSKERSRQLFEHYLTRYPHGRFAAEARTRLGAR